MSKHASITQSARGLDSPASWTLEILQRPRLSRTHQNKSRTRLAALDAGTLQRQGMGDSNMHRDITHRDIFCLFCLFSVFSVYIK
ncbi:hypothetical protein BDV09DRAFT_36137 [Aspergillus tetrazonus]